MAIMDTFEKKKLNKINKKLFPGAEYKIIAITSDLHEDTIVIHKNEIAKFVKSTTSKEKVFIT